MEEVLSEGTLPLWYLMLTSVHSLPVELSGRTGIWHWKVEDSASGVGDVVSPDSCGDKIISWLPAPFPPVSVPASLSWALPFVLLAMRVSFLPVSRSQWVGGTAQGAPGVA